MNDELIVDQEMQPDPVFASDHKRRYRRCYPLGLIVNFDMPALRHVRRSAIH